MTELSFLVAVLEDDEYVSELFKMTTRFCHFPLLPLL